MISAKPAVVVAMLALASVAVTQEKADEQRIAELIEQLGEEDTRKAASERLVALGEPAATALLRVVFRDGQENRSETLLVLARMRDHAELIVPELIQLRDLPPEDWPAFLRAVANLGPYTRMEMEQVLSTFEEDLNRVIAVSEPPEFRAEILNGFLRMSDRNSKTSIRAHSEIRELISALETGASEARVLAAELLGHRGQSAASALPVLHRALLTSHPSVRRYSSVGVDAGMPTEDAGQLQPPP